MLSRSEQLNSVTSVGIYYGWHTVTHWGMEPQIHLSSCSVVLTTVHPCPLGSHLSSCYSFPQFTTFWFLSCCCFFGPLGGAGFTFRQATGGTPRIAGWHCHPPHCCFHCCAWTWMALIPISTWTSILLPSLEHKWNKYKFLTSFFFKLNTNVSKGRISGWNVKDCIKASEQINAGYILLMEKSCSK